MFTMLGRASCGVSKRRKKQGGRGGRGRRVAALISHRRLRVGSLVTLYMTGATFSYLPTVTPALDLTRLNLVSELG